MAEQLYLAANLAQSSLIFGHLQIVYEDEGGNLYETESTSTGFPWFWGDWVYPAFGNRHDDPANTPGYDDPDDYDIVALDLRPGQTAAHVWELLGQIQQALSSGGFGIDYDIDQNSNSYVATLLSVVGIDVADYLDAVTPPSVTSFPGVGTNVLYGAKTGGLFSGDDTPIPLVLAGTAGDDYIKTGIGKDTLGGADGDDLIDAGAGDDLLRGGAGNDRLLGRDGADRLRGQFGNDTLNGGDSADNILGQSGHDRLVGASGNDVLDGGLGWDIMTGGTGADSFRFAYGKDVITDFEDDVDTILIAARLVDGAVTGDDIVNRFGRIEDGHVVLDFGHHQLTIKNLSDLSALNDDLSVY